MSRSVPILSEYNPGLEHTKTSSTDDDTSEE
jgi:hypothetical protein